ncbi:phosphotransferase [Demequina aestuarii]|uniref:phosphotransferase n=1 Tax=Demequina aestuarii TaxID=327095 RepID=UPI00187BDF47|nr:phosphotransferase [Demequina aestuarii]
MSEADATGAPTVARDVGSTTPLDTGPPAAHPSISVETVHALLASQMPHLATHPIGERFDGWDMAMYRLGDALAVRLPRVETAVESLARETRWTAALSPGWSFAYPHVIQTGAPGEGYPWPWAVVTWVPGTTADASPLGAAAGAPVGRAIAEIHGPADAGAGSSHGYARPLVERAWFNPEQSLALTERTAEVMWALGRVEAGDGGPDGARVDPAAARAMWERALDAPSPADQVWSHADLHGSNLLSDQGDFAGIIDWGKIARGDRAVDLAFLYTALPRAGVGAAVAAYREATGVDDAGLDARLLGIALHKCLVWATLDRPLNVAMAWRGLRELGVSAPA